MKLRIARKIFRHLGHGYPIQNTQRLKEAVRVWRKAQRRFKHFKRNVTMSSVSKKYNLWKIRGKSI